MNEKIQHPNITPGDFVEFCLDPRYPSLKKKYKSDELESMFNVNVGVALTLPDKHGYIKIQPTPLPIGWQQDKACEVHVEFCRVLAK